jgi:ferredoxin
MPRRFKALCLNFIENGTCHVNGRKCILGARGAIARNEDYECELHGGFDVWVTDHNLLVTDLGFPAEEPIQSLALRVNEEAAMAIALVKSDELTLPLTTSKRKCIRCGELYWMSSHVRSPGLIQNGCARVCPKCLGDVEGLEMERRLGEQRYWCG